MHLLINGLGCSRFDDELIDEICTTVAAGVFDETCTTVALFGAIAECCFGTFVPVT
jgi:hypothetical protein